MDVEEPAPSVPNEVPAAYLCLFDSRSQNQSQQLLPIWDREIFKIGRDPRSNTLTVDNDPDYSVSRNHCEIYVITYEPTVNYVYVRDRKSSNGTYVNGELIGIGPDISPGYLLQDGDVIEIRPYWTFVVIQERPPPLHDLDSLQLEECKLFADRYILTNRCLGQGAEGAVHLALDAVTRKQLVCKLVNLDKLHKKNPPEELRRKFQEADILRQLRHPNILPYVDTISSPHSLYTFTELASGGDLMSFLYRQDVVKEFDCRIIIRQVVRGLVYLHDKGIVHRDLKPENILLAYSPKIAYHRVMLADFGNSAVPRRSRMVTKVGTVNYQAPEIVTNTQTHTSAVDIWSLGIVVLVLLACSPDPEVQNLNRMSQAEIVEYLKKTFATMSNKPSRDGRGFLWDCLQIAPGARMSAIGAECHDWLCTPVKYLRFFQLLDNKMMLDWKPHDELKPMPWELPSLMNSPKRAEKKPELRCSQYFATQETSMWPPEPPEAIENFTANDEQIFQAEYGIQDELASHPGVLVLRPKSPTKGPLPREAVMKQHQQDVTNQQPKKPIKQLQLPWKGYAKPTHPAQTELRTKRRRGLGMNFRDASLPLPGLERYLRPSYNRHHRQQVLEELEKLKAKFLVDPSDIIPNTPLNMAPRLQTPEAPRAKKRVRHGMGKLGGQVQLSVPKIKLG
ncbi:kinase-like domain-containing protein [Dactylonectria estremocensis]|uniref:non-specific serine/threonine protein kinase n=1 Tax=Dactylonectria estremocensis TaxID=1079267 RepID=A0A9P9FDN8_9HYPO|nr:kinase-like domain-containing protein [Dactylonectria estremocensis]